MPHFLMTLQELKLQGSTSFKTNAFLDQMWPFLLVDFFLFCFLQGVVTPQVSVQGYSATPGTVQAAQPSTTFKKSRYLFHLY